MATDYGVLGDALSAKGMAEGFAEGMSPERMASRRDAYARQEASRQQLQRLKATEPTAEDYKTMAETQSVELQHALSKQQQILREGNRRRTFDGFDRYTADGDVKHLNVMFDDLRQTGSSMYSKISRVDKLTEADKELMDAAGINEELQNLILTNPEVAKSYVKITQTDGSTSFGDVDMLKGVSGYNDYASEKELTRQKTQREIELLTSLGYDTTPTGREAFRRARRELSDADPKSPQFQDALTKYLAEIRKENERKFAPRGSSGSRTAHDKLLLEAQRRASADGHAPGTQEFEDSVTQHYDTIRRDARAAGINVDDDRLFNRSKAEREAARLVEQEGLDYASDPAGFLARYNEVYDEIVERDRETGTQKNIEAAAQAQDNLDEKAGGDFFAAEDLDTPRGRARYAKDIAIIEQGFDKALGVNEKNNIMRLRGLIHLMDRAKNIGPKDTGLLDRFFHNVQTFFSNRVDSADTAAWTALRNVERNALFGATLPPGEQASYREQFGTLYQQHRPVIDQLMVAMEQVQTDLETLMSYGNPHVMHYYLGADAMEAEDILLSIKQTRDMYQAMAEGRAFNVPGEGTTQTEGGVDIVTQPQGTGPTVISPEHRSILDDIYNQNPGGGAPE